MPKKQRLLDDEYDGLEYDELTPWQRLKRWLSRPAKKPHGKGFNLLQDIKAHSWRYGIGFLLMVGAIALFAIPGFAPAIGLGSTLSYLTVATALKLGISFVGAQALLGTAAGLIALFAPVIAGYALKFLGAAIQIGLRALFAINFIINKIIDKIIKYPLTIATYLVTGIVIASGFLASAIGNLFSGKGLFPSNLLSWGILNGNGVISKLKKQAQTDHEKRGPYGKFLAWAGTLLIGWPLNILANLIDIAAITALASLVIAAIGVGLVFIATLILIDYTGCLLYGLGGFCLGEGFSTKQHSWAEKMDEIIPFPTIRLILTQYTTGKEKGFSSYIPNSMSKLGGKSSELSGNTAGSGHFGNLFSNSSSSPSSKPYPTSKGYVIEEVSDSANDNKYPSTLGYAGTD